MIVVDFTTCAVFRYLFTLSTCRTGCTAIVMLDLPVYLSEQSLGETNIFRSVMTSIVFTKCVSSVILLLRVSVDSNRSLPFISFMTIGGGNQYFETCYGFGSLYRLCVDNYFFTVVSTCWDGCSANLMRDFPVCIYLEIIGVGDQYFETCYDFLRLYRFCVDSYFFSANVRRPGCSVLLMIDLPLYILYALYIFLQKWGCVLVIKGYNKK